jgi:hypothetical protein
MIPPNTPFEFEGIDMRPSFRASADGSHIYSVNVMVKEEVWNALKTIPRHKLIGGFLFWNEGQDGDIQTDDLMADLKIKEPTKKDLKPRGEYGRYWHILCKQGLFFMPDLQTAIETELGDLCHDYEQGLRDIFEVSSRTFIDPAAFESWLMKHELSNIVTISRKAQAKAQSE